MFFIATIAYFIWLFGFTANKRPYQRYPLFAVLAIQLLLTIMYTASYLNIYVFTRLGDGVEVSFPRIFTWLVIFPVPFVFLIVNALRYDIHQASVAHFAMLVWTLETILCSTLDNPAQKWPIYGFQVVTTIAATFLIVCFFRRQAKHMDSWTFSIILITILGLVVYELIWTMGTVIASPSGGGFISFSAAEWIFFALDFLVMTIYGGYIVLTTGEGVTKKGTKSEGEYRKVHEGTTTEVYMSSVDPNAY